MRHGPDIFFRRIVILEHALSESFGLSVGTIYYMQTLSRVIFTKKHRSDLHVGNVSVSITRDLADVIIATDFPLAADPQKILVIDDHAGKHFIIDAFLQSAVDKINAAVLADLRQLLGQHAIDVVRIGFTNHTFAFCNQVHSRLSGRSVRGGIYLIQNPAVSFP